jgi:hypothetical protein
MFFLIDLFIALIIATISPGELACLSSASTFSFVQRVGAGFLLLSIAIIALPNSSPCFPVCLATDSLILFLLAAISKGLLGLRGICQHPTQLIRFCFFRPLVRASCWKTLW